MAKTAVEVMEAKGENRQKYWLEETQAETIGSVSEHTIAAKSQANIGNRCRRVQGQSKRRNILKEDQDRGQLEALSCSRPSGRLRVMADTVGVVHQVFESSVFGHRSGEVFGGRRPTTMSRRTKGEGPQDGHQTSRGEHSTQFS